MKLNITFFPAAAFPAATVIATFTATTIVISPADAAAIAPGSTLNLSAFGIGSLFGGGVDITAEHLNFYGPLDFGKGLGDISSNPSSTGRLLDQLFGNADGSGVVGITNSTGTFSQFMLGGGLIKDLDLPSPTASQSNQFLRILGANLSLSPLSVTPLSLGFSLTSWDFSPVTHTAAFTGNFNFNGTLTPGVGLFTAQQFNPTSYSLSITAVPTPALLPGLLALGAGALRKRKAEAKATSAADS